MVFTTDIYLNTVICSDKLHTAVRTHLMSSCCTVCVREPRCSVTSFV